MKGIKRRVRVVRKRPPAPELTIAERREFTIEMEEICEEYFLYFLREDISFPKIKVRRMRSRWGSCNVTDHVITFSTLLYEKDRIYKEYVAVHELCHLIHPNHSKDFYVLVAKFLPNWKKLRAELNA
ncbi:MAG: M48 family metallopeptidase [Lachnospiraceae bacterium]